VPKIRFNLRPPTNPDDYPFTPAALPAEAPVPRSTLYLSAADSYDPEGKAITTFWNVQDQTAKYLTVDPDPSATRISFSPAFVGPLAITLAAVEVGGLQQLAQTMVTLTVAPSPCAEDGFSPPCSDELAVPGGTFMAGSADDVGFPNEHPSHPANLAPFMMDKYEVTVGRFRRFLAGFVGDGFANGIGAHPLIPGSGWQSTWNGQTSESIMMSLSECGGTWTDTVGVSEARPISCVTWYQAFAFCISEGKRLPTQTEWEYAAAGGSEQRTYPWGNDNASIDRAVYGCWFDGQKDCSDTDLPVVGSLHAGAGRWGHLDLAGSVWEWTLDAYGPYTGALCDNCANLSVMADDGRVFRGGDYLYDDEGEQSDLRAASRLAFDAKFPDPTRGMRCARTP
jgi:formylglycine-generating enzyme